MGARDRIRTYFEEHVGQVVHTDDVAQVAGIREYARRIRELRNDEGMQISTHNDRHDLKPGEYRLETLERLPVAAEDVSPGLRNVVLERDGFTCQLCGAGVGDSDAVNQGRSVRLHVDHIVPLSQGGKTEADNLRTLCSTCNQGRSNIQTPSESALNLLARIRRAPRSVQKELFEALRRSVGDSTKNS